MLLLTYRPSLIPPPCPGWPDYCWWGWYDWVDDRRDWFKLIGFSIGKRQVPQW